MTPTRFSLLGSNARDVWLRVGGALAVVVLVAEIVLRFGLGLGNPPLFVTHPEIGYILAPNQETWTLGRRYLVNAHGMRSAPLQAQKTSRNELRLLVVGDSVVNGGVLIDHGDLATTRLEQSLARQQERVVRVANISAGGWAPKNWMGYLKMFGAFDADVIIFVFSSHDYFNLHKETPLTSGNLRMKKPISALVDVVSRLLPRVLFAQPATRRGGVGTRTPKATSETAIADLIEFARRESRGACVVLHSTQTEMLSRVPDPGGIELRNFLERRDVPTVSDASALRRALDAGGAPFADNIHLTVLGQRILKEVLMRASKSCLADGAGP